MRLLILVVVLAPFFSTPARTQTAPDAAMQNPSARQTVSLNGAWHIIVDPLESGVGAKYYRNHKPKDSTDLVEYDFDASETLNVPGDWNTQKEKLLFYEGPLWYEKSFVYKKREHTRVFVHFGAVHYVARVFLNGEKLGEHEGGFTAFEFEVSDKLKDGENFLVVEANNARRPDAVPALHTDWWNYGGITRDVLLAETPETFIRDYWLQTPNG